MIRTSHNQSVLMQAIVEGGSGAASIAPVKTSIRPNVAGYTTAKSASGSTTKICGDNVSKSLLGATLDETYGFVSKVVSQPETELRAKYGARNLGQQRMFLGNLIRGAFAGKNAERAEQVRVAFEANLPAFREVVDARVAGDVKAAAAVKQAKADERAKVKTEAKVKADADKATKKVEADKVKAATAAAKPAPAPKAPMTAKTGAFASKQ